MRPKPPSIKQIAQAWQGKIEVDVSNMETQCWACGKDVNKPVKAHIIAHSSGGSSEPDNFFLLCDSCHAEQPDGCDISTQLEWIRTHPSWFDIHVEEYLRLAKYMLKETSSLIDTNIDFYKHILNCNDTKHGCSRPGNERSSKLWGAAKAAINEFNSRSGSKP